MSRISLGVAEHPKICQKYTKFHDFSICLKSTATNEIAATRKIYLIFIINFENI